MQTPLPCCALAAVLLVSSAASVRGQMPDPATSEIDPCVNVGPAGDLVYEMTVRDSTGAPLAGVRVDLTFCSCDTLPSFCASEPADPYVFRGGGCQVQQITDEQGRAEIPLRAGGRCAGSEIPVRASFVQLGTVNLASPDLNGDLVVDADDRALMTAVILANEDPPDFDLNCDGSVNHIDRGILDAHLGHNCLTTPVFEETWGTVKSHYR